MLLMADPGHIIQEAQGSDNICQLTHTPLAPKHDQHLGVGAAQIWK